MRAASLAAELNDVGHDTTIEEGGKGQFDVLAGGELVFSKQEQGRFPDGDELHSLLE